LGAAKFCPGAQFISRIKSVRHGAGRQAVLKDERPGHSLRQILKQYRKFAPKKKTDPSALLSISSPRTLARRITCKNVRIPMLRLFNSGSVRSSLSNAANL